ncbi:MAG: replication initiator protein A [Candidatus Korobacteraceae bacterium]
MSKARFYNPQFDLFLPTIVDLRFRDQKDTMERPFFSLSKSKRMKPIEYVNENDGIFVTVQPHQDYGMATIWDADILIWAASVLCDMKNRGTNDIPRELKFQPHDLLKAIARSTGGRDYAQLRDSLERLKTTVVTTNIRVKRSQKTTMFSWIDQWDDLIDAQTKESRGLTLTVSDWFYRGVMEDGGVLSIDPAYFSITGGRERWLYRVARKHAGGNGADGFAISMPVLFEKSGAEGTYRSNATPIRTIFREAFNAAGQPYFNPHSFRKTLARLGEVVCQSPEHYKAWSQNLGHEQVLTTFMSYGEVPCDRQGEIIRGLATPQQAGQSDADEIAEAVFRKFRDSGLNWSARPGIKARDDKSSTGVIALV